MNELMRQCLSLPLEDRKKLSSLLCDSIADETTDNGRFDVIVRAASEAVGTGIINFSRDHKCCLGRQMVAYQMRLEGYTLQAIGRRLLRHHASVAYMVKIMEDAFRYPVAFKEEMRYWKEFTNKLQTYDIHSRTTQGS